MLKKLTKDQIRAIWILKKLDWSDRRIGDLMKISRMTVARYYENECKDVDSGRIKIDEPENRPEPQPDIVYVGNSTDLELINAMENQRTTGGGRKVAAHHYNQNWEDDNEDE